MDLRWHEEVEERKSSGRVSLEIESAKVTGTHLEWVVRISRRSISRAKLERRASGMLNRVLSVMSLSTRSLLRAVGALRVLRGIGTLIVVGERGLHFEGIYALSVARLKASVQPANENQPKARSGVW